MKNSFGKLFFFQGKVKFHMFKKVTINIFLGKLYLRKISIIIEIIFVREIPWFFQRKIF